jgi:predicted nuclease of restriction endonuclease-like (RecB) superfamily
MCRIEGWSVRTLRERIDSILYERTALSKQPDALIRRSYPSSSAAKATLLPRSCLRTLMYWIFWA